MQSRADWKIVRGGAAILAILAVAGCQTSASEKEDPLAATAVDEANLNDLLLNAGDPKAAVTYFETAVAREPERADFRQNLARAYARVKRYPEAARVFQELVALDQARPADRLEYAYVNVRLKAWEDATKIAATLPRSMDGPRRHLLDAIIADHSENWDEADAAYARAANLSNKPAEIYNNWGVSQMSRGDLGAAEKTFRQALSYDSRLFSAKNNLAIVRGLGGRYTLPVVPLTDTERAIIYNNLGLIALRKGDDRIARGLFATAIETHPEHYAAAADRLAALEGSVAN